MIQIRKGVFETNSSSMHSLVIGGSDFMDRPAGPMSIYYGDYHWGYDTLCTTHEKLSYVMTSIASNIPWEWEAPEEVNNEHKREFFRTNKYHRWVIEMVEDFTGYPPHLPDWEDAAKGDYGGIDHQSIESSDGEGFMIANILDEFWSTSELTFKDGMREFIFNNKYSVTIDNDNHLGNHAASCL